MPIDFFVSPCTKLNGNCQIAGLVCSTNTNQNRFGLSDDDSTLRQPAKVKLNDEPNWDFTIENPAIKNVNFKAVDFCVDIFRTGTYSLDDDNRIANQFSSDSVNCLGMGLIKRCEGFLQFDSTILFVEIKRRPKGNWLSDAFDWTKGAVNTVGNTVLPVLKSTKIISRGAKYLPGGAVVSDAADLVGLGRQGGRAAQCQNKRKD